MAVHTLLGLAFAGMCWALLLAVYRVYFSPLAKFPGRRLAVSTMWYEFYYQAVRGGQYPWEVQKMHKEYGRSS